jgi:alcohol dehydrogenase (cytochrome c)
MNKARAAIAALLVALVISAPSWAAEQDWPSYNRALTSERFVPYTEIMRANVGKLRKLCTYDTGIETSFQTGPIVVAGTLYATTEADTFAVDASNCKERWRVHEDVVPTFIQVNRGVALADGRLFRGLQDGRVVAYDARDGRRIWEQRIADPAIGETVPAAPITWSGLVFIGNAGGDNYGVKGRMYALDAATGRIAWEFYLVPREHPRSTAQPPGAEAGSAEGARAASWGNEADVPIAGGATWTSYTLDPETGLLYVPGGNPAPDFVNSLRPGENLYTNSVVVLDAKTGAYRAHFTIVPEDFHDWDVSAAPVVTTTKSGERRLLVAPKDGHLYGFDLKSKARRFRTPVTTIENATAPLTAQGTRFCPGTQGGSEWNGPAYNPSNNLVYTGTVDWCATVKVAPEAKVKNAAMGQPWSGAGDEFLFGKMDPVDKARGWLTATDADSGQVRWRFAAPAPILAAVTPTAGGLVFFGDMTGNLYGFDADSGKQLLTRKLDGALGGGIISYQIDGHQRLAVTYGLQSPIWPAPKTTAKIDLFGL